MTAAVTVAKERARAKREGLELAMLQQLRALKLDEGMVREYRFDMLSGRGWRFDFAFPARRLALEVEGGSWTGGRHVTGAGFAADAEKYAHAAIQGWRVIRATSDQVRSGIAAGWVQKALAQ